MHIRRGTAAVNRGGVALMLVICLMYAIVTFTKLNFGAGISFFVSENIFTKTESGAISAAFYICYAAGQLTLSGLIDKYSPFIIVMIGLIGSLVINIALCFTASFTMVLILWSLNGLIQFGVWPGAVVMVTNYLPDEHQKTGNLGLTISIGIGGILSYLCVTPILEATGWLGLFIFNGVILVLMILLWVYAARHSSGPAKPVIREKKGNAAMPPILRTVLILIAVISFTQALMCNGIKTWVPTMIMESYNTSVMWASLLNVLLYVTNLAGAFALVWLVRSLRNELAIFGIFFALCLPFLWLMLYIGDIAQSIVVIALVIVTTLTYAMYSINIRVSAKFASYGFSGKIASIINGFASLGVVAASGGFGYLAEQFNWGAVTVACLGITGFALLVCIPAALLWHAVTNTIPRV